MGAVIYQESDGKRTWWVLKIGSSMQGSYRSVAAALKDAKIWVPPLRGRTSVTVIEGGKARLVEFP